MALNRTKVIETAQKQLAKGNFDKAIAEYEKLVREDPRDVRTWLKIGDIYTRKGARGKAVETYLRVAEHYAEQGFFLKAVAVYKQILKLDASRVDVTLRLADMYEQLALVSDALNTYEQVAASLARNGDIDRALAVLGKMADLDPENIPVRIKYAEALSKASKTEKAAEEFQRGADLLKQQGRHEDYLKVAERLLYHKQADTALARELAEAYLARNDPKRALAKLQLAFKANPRDVRTLELLARAFHVLGQAPKTISVYKEIAKIYGEANRNDERLRMLQKVLELDPTDAEAKQALSGHVVPPAPREVSQKLVMPAAAVIGSSMPRRLEPDPVPELDDDDDLLEDDLEMLDADDEMLLDDEGEAAPAGDEGVVILDDEGDEESESLDIDIEEASIEVEEPVAASAGEAEAEGADIAGSPEDVAALLAEVDVFLRYGLQDKIIAQLERVVGIAPDHVEAREKLKDAYLTAGLAEDAAAQLYELAKLFHAEHPQLAHLYLRQYQDLTGREPEPLPAPEARAPAPATPVPPTPTPLPEPPTAEIPLDAVADEGGVMFVDDEGEAEPTATHEVPPAPAPEPVAAARRESALPPVLAGDDDDLEALLADEPALEPAATPPPVAPPPVEVAPERIPTPIPTPPPPPPMEAEAHAGPAELPPSAIASAVPPAMDEEPLLSLEDDDGFDLGDGDPPTQMVAIPDLGFQEPDEGEPATTSEIPVAASGTELATEPPLAAEPEAMPAVEGPPPMAAPPLPPPRFASPPAAPDPTREHLAPPTPAPPPPMQGDAGSPPPAGEVPAQLLVAALSAPIAPDDFHEAPAAHEVAQAKALAVQRASLPPGEVEEILDEAEFFMAQGLWDEARDTLEDALVSHPNHPLLGEKLQEVEEAAAAAAAAPAPVGDESFALAEKLAEELEDAGEGGGAVEAEEIDVENVFAQFKKGVEEQIGLEDSDTHFDLGIAYKEMGLLDDAVGEFKLAMSNPSRECLAHTMIGICYIEQGKLSESISHFKKGLYADAKTEREELGLYYELGNAYELLKDPKEALYYFQKVQKRDPDFRGIADRIQRLMEPAPAPEEMVEPMPSVDDVDQAFDDLLGDD